MNYAAYIISSTVSNEARHHVVKTQQSKEKKRPDIRVKYKVQKNSCLCSNIVCASVRYSTGPYNTTGGIIQKANDYKIIQSITNSTLRGTFSQRETTLLPGT